MSAGFEVNERIAADSVLVAEWPLCQLRLMDDRRFPWLLLLPRKPGLEEWTELAEEELAVLAVGLSTRQEGAASAARRKRRRSRRNPRYPYLLYRVNQGAS